MLLSCSSGWCRYSCSFCAWDRHFMWGPLWTSLAAPVPVWQLWGCGLTFGMIRCASYTNRHSKSYPIEPLELLTPNITSWQHRHASQEAWSICWCHPITSPLSSDKEWAGSLLKYVHIGQVGHFDTEDVTEPLLLLLLYYLFPGAPVLLCTPHIIEECFWPKELLSSSLTTN